MIVGFHVGGLPTRFLCFLACATLILPNCGKRSPTQPLALCQLPRPPAISFTFVPAVGSFEDVRGLVALANSPCDARELRVAMYIHVPGFRPEEYFCKPTQAMPHTTIEDDGRWVADYTTGGRDEEATEIVAFLVASDFNGNCFRIPGTNDEGVFAAISVQR